MAITKEQRNTEIVKLDLTKMTRQELKDWAWENMNKAQAAESLIDAYSHKQNSVWSQEVYKMLANGITRQSLEDYLK